MTFRGGSVLMVLAQNLTNLEQMSGFDILGRSEGDSHYEGDPSFSMISHVA